VSSNLLLVSLDTLRADVAFSGRYPNFERLRRAGTAFRKVVSSVPLTPPSHATIFTGLQPERHGIRHLLRERLNAGTQTLASVLARAGYTTGAIVSCPGLNEWYGLGHGFQHYDDDIPRLPDGRNAVELADVKLRGLALKRAPLVVERSLEWLGAKPSSPFFLFAHFFDTHWPYEPPASYGLEVPNAYEGEVAYVDHHLGKLLDGFERAGHSLDEMLVVVLSDHGEDLAGWYPNDHAGECGHPQEEGHGCLLFDATQLVPLVLRWPGHVPVGEVPYQVRLCDVFPTILELLGIRSPDRLDGASLVPYLEKKEQGHRLAYCETFFPEELAGMKAEFSSLKPLRAIRFEDRYKLVWEVGGSRAQVFDLASDPEEKHPAPFDRDGSIGRELVRASRELAITI
jgi:arylsulfatase